MPERQAEALAESLAEVALGQLATKDDIRSVREEIRQVREDLRTAVAELRHEITESELRLRAEFREELRKQTLWFFAMQVALASAAFALMKILS